MNRQALATASSWSLLLAVAFLFALHSTSTITSLPTSIYGTRTNTNDAHLKSTQTTRTNRSQPVNTTTFSSTTTTTPIRLQQNNSNNNQSTLVVATNKASGTNVTQLAPVPAVATQSMTSADDQVSRVVAAAHSDTGTNTSSSGGGTQTMKNNCSSVCSSDEFAAILQRIINDEHKNDEDTLLRRFELVEEIGNSEPHAMTNVSLAASLDLANIRPVCVRELIGLIKSLASTELEMKTMLEFASDSASASSPSPTGQPIQPMLQAGNKSSSESPSAPAPKSTKSQELPKPLDLAQIRWLQSGANRSCIELGDNQGEAGAEQQQASRSLQQQQQHLHATADDQIHQVEAGGVVSEKSRVLPKIVANVDHWINALERFTATREWSSLMKVFKGAESILDMFVTRTSAPAKATSQTSFVATAAAKPPRPVLPLPAASNVTTTVAEASTPPNNNNKPSNSNSTLLTSAGNGGTGSSGISQQSKVMQASASSSSPATSGTTNDSAAIFIDQLKQNLPVQVLTLTNSLNNLFPWHVWPWNNLDLYSTVDTFLNHGIFAFSRTTVGPERRIDYLPEMLQTLFNSLKFESFPKRCADWSKIICDQAAYHDRLALAPAAASPATNGAGDETDAAAGAARAAKVKEMASVSKNQLTQELTCIAFSSLSMQHFGAGKDFEAAAAAEEEFGSSGGTQTAPQSAGKRAADQLQAADDQGDASSAASNNRLPWDRQVRKAIKLYTLSREALTDDQWLALYTLIKDLWAQQRIPDRVIMVGRVIQLLTNCHMPKEMLESALWKDIYKYKNVLNQLMDIVIEELNRSSETGKLTIHQIDLGSQHLHEILERFIQLLPRLLESLSKTLVDELPELVGRLFSERQALFKAPCKGHSFADIVPQLGKHRKEILEIERLVCDQLATKPNITMMQINNLTNDFLAMAFNFSNFGSALALPKAILTNLEASGGGVPAVATVTTTTTTSAPPMRQQSRPPSAAAPSTASLLEVEPLGTLSGGGGDGDLEAAASSASEEQSPIGGSNATVSIIDEMAANPRLAQIVAILQSSALDPPEVHAELPELDWVEAGTSIALLYESVQKLISYEEPFTIFPEIAEFQDEMRTRLESSQQMFKKFSKRDPIRLVAYSLDAIMPVALRTYKPADSFHAECLSSFRDIFSEPAGDVTEAKATRQWPCLVSSMNFGSWAVNNFMKLFNSMFRNVLAQMTPPPPPPTGTSSNRQQQQQLLPLQVAANETAAATATSCIFLDGSVSMMLDNLPQFIDLGLETVLMASTSSGEQSQQQLTLYDVLCNSSNYTLDPFNERSIELKSRMKDKMCHLFHKQSLANCAQVLKWDQWKWTMRELNSTWFQTNALSITPSFREITLNAHEFLELFGQFKPSTMSDSLIARILNVNSFWTKLLNRIMSIIDKYQEKRFEYALQTLTPIIYDNLPTSGAQQQQQQQQSAAAATNEVANLREVRETLITTILGAKAILSYLDKQSSNANNNNRTSNSGSNHDRQFETQIQSLFNWADQYALTSAEVLLRTMANNMTKMESIFKPTTAASNVTSVSRRGLSMREVWFKFCESPVDMYLDFGPVATAVEGPAAAAAAATQPTSNSSVVTASQSPELQRLYLQMSEGKESICKFQWQSFYNQLAADSNKTLAGYPERQLTRIALTKWGQVLDVMLIESKSIKQLPKFFYMDYWQPFREKLPQITPLKEQPSNLVWIWEAFERMVDAMDAASYGASSQTSIALQRILDQLNCGLDAVKGGLSWENIANIYQDKQDILAAHSTINNGFALASIGVNTFFAHKKFQRFLDELVKPRVGFTAFCDMRDRQQLEAIFSIPAGGDFLAALESFQELICDTNFETLAQNINPISVCYQVVGGSAGSNAPTTTTQAYSSSLLAPTPTSSSANQQQQQHPLAEVMDRFFKLASLAILDAKLVAASDAKPPILDKNRWSGFWDWWSSDKAEPQPKSNIALTVVRAFQTIDSINSEHVVWKALFRSIHELSEVAAYLLRAVEKRHQDVDLIGAASRLSLVKEAASQIDSAFRSAGVVGGVVVGSNSSAGIKQTGAGQPPGQQQQHQLASTLSNIMFPEVNNFISFRTFKQLRYIKSISDYFTTTPGAQDSICQSIEGTTDEGSHHQQHQRSSSPSSASRRIELIGYKLNTNEKLFSLLCHYHSSHWLTALNIVISTRTSAVPKKVNYMTKYLSIFARTYKDTDQLESFIHSQQLENIEQVTNTTVSYLLATSHHLKQLSFSKISNISWHSLPNLLDSIDRHLCASKYEPGTFQIPVYEPKKPELETVLCKLPQWNITQVYNYFSENFDLQNMISLISASTSSSSSPSSSVTSQQQLQQHDSSAATSAQKNRTAAQRVCVTPFKFASRWLKIAQDTADEIMSKASRDKLKKCLNSSRKGQSFYSQSLRYMRFVNSMLASVNDLTGNDSWHIVKKTWNSISYLLLNQQPTYGAKLY